MNNVVRWVWFPLGAVIRFVMRNGKRIGVSIAGFTLVAIGIALMVLPGPGLLLVIVGLAILASEYVWAQRMLNFAKRKADQAKGKVLGRKPEDPDVGGAG